MSPAMSLQGYLGIEEETTYGNDPGTVSKFLPLLSESITTDTGKIFPEEIRGDRSRHTAVEGPISVDGDIEFQVGPENGLGEMLKWTFGNESNTSTPNQGTVVHTFQPDTDLDSFKTEIDVGDSMIRHVLGCKVDSLSVEFASEEVGGVTASVVGKEERTSATSSSSPSYTEIRPFKWEDGEVTIDGTMDANVESLTLDFANNLVDDLYTIDEDERGVKDLPEGLREITGSMDLNFEDADYYEWMLGGGTEPQSEPRTVSMNFKFTGPFISGSSGSAYQFEATIPQGVFSTDEANISGSDRVVEGVEFDAIYDETAGFDIQAKLTNTEKSGGY